MAITTAELLAQENKPIKTSDLTAMEESTPLPDVPSWIKPFNMMDKPEPLPYDFDTAINKYVEANGGDANKSKKDLTESLYEGFVQPWEKVGYTSAASFNRGMAVFSTHLDLISDYLGEKTGTQKGGAFEKAAKTYNDNTEYWQKKADQSGAAFLPELLGEATGGAIPGIAEFILNIPYAGLLGAANKEQQAEKGRSELSNALVEAAKRGSLGLVFHQIAQFKKYLSAPMMGGVFGLQTAAEGGDAKEIAKGVGTGLIYGATSPGGRMGLNDIRRNFEKEIVLQKAEAIPQTEAEIKQAMYEGNPVKAETLKDYPDLAIERGQEIVQRIIKDHTDYADVLYRDDVGSIAFPWGKEGNPERKFEGGYGVSHIVSKHGETVANKIVEVIAKGELVKESGPEGGNRVDINYDGHTAILSLYKEGNRETWLLTGWKDYEKTPGELGGVYGPNEPTRDGTTRFRPDTGAEVGDNIQQSGNDRNINNPNLTQIKEPIKYTADMFPKDMQIEVSRIKDGKIFKEKVTAEEAIKELDYTRSMADRLKAFKECIG